MSELYNDATMAFDDKRDSAAEELVYVLHDSVQREEQRKERMTRGEFYPEDYGRPKI